MDAVTAVFFILTITRPDHPPIRLVTKIETLAECLKEVEPFLQAALEGKSVTLTKDGARIMAGCEVRVPPTREH